MDIYQEKFKNSTFCFLTTLLSIVIAFFYLRYLGFHFYSPAVYYSDGLMVNTLVKTLVETGWYLYNPKLSVPDFYDFSGFPMSEGANFLIMKVFALGTKNSVLIINLFYFLSFPLTAFFSWIVLRWMGINKWFSLTASLLFCFIPFHILRVGHLFLSAIYVIPLYVFLILSVTQKNIFFDRERNTSKTKKILSYLGYVIICLFCASSGVYYAFFAAFFLLISGITTSFEKKRWFPLGNAVILVMLLSCTLMLNIFPSMLKENSAHEAYVRSPIEADVYGLKITQLLMPIAHHRLKSFANFSHYYNGSIQGTEAYTSSLGLLGSLGFLLMIFILFLKRSDFFQKLQAQGKLFFDLTYLNISAILLATVGGFGSFLSYLITPLIRGYNRISVFISFFSLAAFFLLIQSLLKSCSSSTRMLLIGIITFSLLLFGLFDQLPFFQYSDPSFSQKDREFIAKIENKMPQDSKIMQFPPTHFPEGETIHKMGPYDHLKGYLHSKDLYWSFGAAYRSPYLIWQKEVAKAPVHQMIPELINAGFTGLYLNREGYSDSTLENKITAFLQEKPLINEDNNIVFYDLRPYAQKRMHNSADAKIIAAWGEGFYPLEKNETETWRWSQKKSLLELLNMTTHSVPVKFKCQVRTLATEPAQLQIRSSSFKSTIKLTIDQNLTAIEKTFTLAPGKNWIQFKTNAKTLYPPNDNRPLTFALYNCTITHDQSTKASL